MSINYPCRHCNERRAGCHSICADYKEARAEGDRALEAQKRDTDFTQHRQNQKESNVLYRKEIRHR